MSLNTLHKSQIGFLPNNRTADHVFTRQTLIDKYVQNHKEKICACFVDFRKAFDLVWHVGFLHKLLQITVGDCFYNLIKAYISTLRTQSKLPKSKHDPSVMWEVMREGCILSPLLFNLYISKLPSAFENTLWDPFVLPNGAKLNSLFYADDLIILSWSETGLQNCLDKFFLLYFVDDENQSQEN